jgi:predicted  nucleic acid-binding Zn-ribbon protein
VRELGPHLSGGRANTRPFDPHQECQRLYALSLSGELSAEETQWLDAHLSVCVECKGGLSEYEQLVGSVMPEPSDQDRDTRTEEHTSTWSIEDAERRLFAALPAQSSQSVSSPHVPQSHSLWRAIGRYGIAAALLIGVLVLGYEIGHRNTQTFASQKPVQPAQPSNLPAMSSTTQASRPVASDRTELLDREVASLRDQIGSLNLDIAKLQEQRNQQDERLAAQSQALESSSHSEEELRERLAKAESDRQALTVQLASVEADRSKELADASALRAQLRQVNGTLQSRESDIAQDQELLKHDRDIRNLITARDLYIAEIYDVAKTGNTQKPFGRIFYTRGKSLIFYGYDLDQQPGLRNAATFQAWGRRGADDHHDVNLGILYEDDASQKRWALKFNDSATLAKIDAVFVTVEPKGGSTKPTGKPLLFASLHIDPNHP